MPTSDILENLTDAQHEAVVHMDGPMLVVAGAGSGKTRVVTRRIAHLISKGVWPSQILAMTFTNKAAREMKERIGELTGAEPPRWVGTFHSACAKLLRRDLDKLSDDSRTGSFTIYDSGDQKSILKLCLKEFGVDTKSLSPAQAQTAISKAKVAMIDPDEYMPSAYFSSLRLDEVYAAYERRLREFNAVDFDDLLLLVVRLLESRPDVRDMYHGRFRHLLIDEYQDTNRIQYRLMKLLGGPAHNVHVTGDPDQSIYSWRGAEYRNIMEFTEDFPDARVVRLEQNYRSTQTILDVANELIEYNFDRISKELFTENPIGCPVGVIELPNGRHEALWVANRVQELYMDRKRLSDMAVFYRTNAQSRALEDAFIDAAIPYQVLGGLRFYERKEIKDMLAQLRIMVNPRDTISLERVVGSKPVGVGAKTFAKILDRAAANDLSPLELLQREDFSSLYGGRGGGKKVVGFADWCRGLAELPLDSVGDCVAEAVSYSGLVSLFESQGRSDPLSESRIDNLGALVDRAYEFARQRPDADLRLFLEEMALVADVDAHDPETDAVSLMTLHSSKGLEFPFVFIVGLESGLLPHRNSCETQEQLEEERRLLYVGLTRAKEEAVLLHVQVRSQWGRDDYTSPSPFLAELPEEGVERLDLSGGGAFDDW
ncbi:MAG: UvrD-helicase domain-containing protein [Lentisphaeria bacterium]|nr:UvrD-helicase domain-containing protein [Lentisphaeria bacterium]